LAFPDEHYNDPKMDAADVFTAAWANSAARNLKIIVAGPSYQGVTVIAKALLGGDTVWPQDAAGAQSNASRYSDGFAKPCTCADLWSIIWLQSSDQLRFSSYQSFWAA
jgi:hypothetical protein